MNSANQMAEEIYGLYCDIGRLENLVKHWKTEFINEQDYAKMMELEADEAKVENAKLRDEIKRRDELEAKLIRCIENDYGILFAWDPLRKVWLSECTDEYVTERERLDAENAKLREACAELLKMAESSDPEWLHWPEMHDELRELGVETDE